MTEQYFQPIQFEEGEEATQVDLAPIAEAAENVVSNMTEEDSSIVGEVVSDIGKGVVNGLAGAGHGLADLMFDGVNAVAGTDIEAPAPKKLDTGIVGDLTSGLTQFSYGYATGGALLKMLGWGVKGKGAVDSARAITAGGIGDFSVFTGDEGRLADFLSQNPTLDKIVPDYLETDMEDGEFEKRFKTAIEGGAIGFGVDATLSSIKGMKRVRNLLNQDKPEEALEEALKTKVEVSESIYRTSADEAQGVADNPVFLRLTTADKQKLTGNFKQRLNETGDIYRSLEEADFNFEKMGLDDDPIQVIQAVSDVLSHEVDATVEGVRNFDKVIKEAADYLAMPVEQFTESMATTFKSAERLDSKVVAMKAVVGKYAKDIDTFAKQLDKDPENPALQQQLGKAWKQLAEMQMTFKGTQTNVARALNAQKIIPGEDLSKAYDDVELQQLMNGQLEPSKVRVLTDRLKYVEGAPHAMSRTVRSGFKKTVDYHNEYWQNAILSGPGTQEIAFVSNLIKTLSMDVERVVAGVGSGNMELAKEGIDLLAGQLINAREGLRMAKKSFLNEKNFLDPEVGIDDVLPSRLFKAGDGKVLTDSKADSAVNFLGKTVNIPRTGLGAQDEFFKTMNYRSHVRAKALREARSQNLDAGQTAELIQRRLNSSVTMDGKFLDKQAMEFARSSTFTNELGEGSVGHSIQKFVAKHPTARVFLPFVRTPVNLFREVHRRTPIIGKYQFQMKQRLAQGGEEAAKAKAEIATGYAMYGLAAFSFMQGKITGKAPSDPTLREAWLSENKQEYSVNVGTEENPNWKPYRKLDPFGAFLGLTADALTMSGELPDKQWEEILPIVVSSISANLSSKAFLAGTIDKLDALVSGEPWKVEREFLNHMGSYVPNAVKQMNDDPYMREARSFLDAMGRGIRGYSEDMPPRRNVFGQPIESKSVAYRVMHPFVGIKEKNDPVYEAVMEVGKGVPPLPEVIASGRIDLTDKRLANDEGVLPYDRWAELMSTKLNGNKTLYDEVKALVTSPRWEKLSNSTDEYSAESSKYKALLTYVQTYREAAFQQVQKEFPKLKNAVMLDKQNKHKAFIGQETAPLVE